MRTHLDSDADIPRLAYAKLCVSDEPLHAMRYHWFPKSAGPESTTWYRRDCVLLGLVQGGTGELAEPGAAVTLEAGGFYLVGPEQVYRLRPRAVVGLCEMRVVVRADWAAALVARHAASLPEAPWAGGALACWRQFDHEQMRWFGDWVEQLMRDRVDPLLAEAFFLDVLQRLRRLAAVPVTTAGGATQALPAWLRNALIEMTAGGNLQGGVARLVQLAGHSSRHINRLCRRHLGCSSGELVTRLRMEYAARKLRLGDEAIGEVADMVGLRNRSHFTRLFTRAYGMSPGRYRQARR